MQKVGDNYNFFIKSYIKYMFGKISLKTGLRDFEQLVKHESKLR